MSSIQAYKAHKQEEAIAAASCQQHWTSSVIMCTINMSFIMYYDGPLL